MSAPKDGGQAFPVPEQHGQQYDAAREKWEEGHICAVPGMSLRAWFAGMAMQAVISNPDTVSGTESVVMYAVKYADALIAELEKEAT
jgi:hypothetical protein